MIEIPHYNIMLDLETLDTRATAIVLSIGAVFFTPHSPTANRDWSEFYRELSDFDHQDGVLGRTISDSTVNWWREQPDVTKSVFIPMHYRNDEHKKISVVSIQALKDLTEWYNGLSIPDGASVAVWGNGASFDNAIISDLYSDMRMETPWHFTQDRCFRTMKNFVPSSDPVEQNMQPHNALEDAKWQARKLLRIFDVLNQARW